jgi:hypothetical protein
MMLVNLHHVKENETILRRFLFSLSLIALTNESLELGVRNLI